MEGLAGVAGLISGGISGYYAFIAAKRFFSDSDA